MSISTNTHGNRIRELFRDASSVTIVAPFIKTNAFRSLLDAIPLNVPLRCVTRWLPAEIAAGVSDPEVIDMLEQRGAYELLLADRLHAKLYIADNRCLAGSANVTLAGLGESNESGNIEVLVDTDLGHPSVVDALRSIERDAVAATQSMAKAVRRLASALRQTPGAFNSGWYPVSRHAEQAYRLYHDPPMGFLSAANQILLADVARSNLRPGLDEQGFRAAIRDLLAAIPIAATLLDASEDKLLTRADANPYIETLTTDDYGSRDLWAAFVDWMAYFYDDIVMKQEISEIALRRAQLLNDP